MSSFISNLIKSYGRMEFLKFDIPSQLACPGINCVRNFIHFDCERYRGQPISGNYKWTVVHPGLKDQYIIGENSPQPGIHILAEDSGNFAEKAVKTCEEAQTIVLGELRRATETIFKRVHVNELHRINQLYKTSDPSPSSREITINYKNVGLLILGIALSGWGLWKCYRRFYPLQAEHKTSNDLLSLSSVVDKNKISQCSLENNEEQKTITLQFGDAQIVLKMNSDITTEKADFIVNAANERMLGGGGVDGSIGRAGGEELLLFRKLVPANEGIRCPVGEARLTDAGRLPASFCIHAVGPRFNLEQSKKSQAQLLHVYTDSLKIAHECIDSFESGKSPSILKLEEELSRSGISLPDPAIIKNAEKLQQAHQEKMIEKLQNQEPISISFPTISTGIFGYPRSEGAILALQAVLQYLQSNQGKPGIKVVQFVFLDQQADLPHYQQALREIEQIVNSQSND